MKVLLVNGSPHSRGCTYTALQTVADELGSRGLETELLHLGAGPVRDCTACDACRRSPGRCAFDGDVVNVLIEKAREADGFVFGSPVYFAHPSGLILSVLDRAFRADRAAFAHKPAAAVASARRAGSSATLDVLQKYFTISQMPVVASTYWTMVHGMQPEEVRRDLEGLQTLRNLAANMAWLLDCIRAGRAAGIEAPRAELTARTHFIR